MNTVLCDTSAVKMPTAMPKKYRHTMMSAPCPGKNAAVRKP